MAWGGESDAKSDGATSNAGPPANNMESDMQDMHVMDADLAGAAWNDEANANSSTSDTDRHPGSDILVPIHQYPPTVPPPMQLPMHGLPAQTWIPISWRSHL
jgi:hypothetical protein